MEPSSRRHDCMKFSVWYNPPANRCLYLLTGGIKAKNKEKLILYAHMCKSKLKEHSSSIYEACQTTEKNSTI
jgi:hypothetical protein